MNDYRPIELTSILMKHFGQLVKTFITSSLPDSGLEETGFSNETWNVEWIYKYGGSFSLTAGGLIIYFISNGPIY